MDIWEKLVISVTLVKPLTYPLYTFPQVANTREKHHSHIDSYPKSQESH